MGHYSASDFPFKGSIGQLIGVSAATKDRILEKHLAALDITAAQFKVLIFVGLNRANSPVELCRELSVDSGSMTRMLARLEKKGCCYVVAVPKTAVACAWISAKRDGRSRSGFL